jgi:EXPERA (EXPanded EBP superfamily)
MLQRENLKTGQEYAAADRRWGTADPTVVSIELLTVFGAGTLAVWIVYQIVRRNPERYYWIVVLSTAELYGGYVSFYLFIWPFGYPEAKTSTLLELMIDRVHSWMTFAPEWLSGSPALNTSNPLHLWVYLFVSFFFPVRGHGAARILMCISPDSL